MNFPAIGVMATSSANTITSTSQQVVATSTFSQWIALTNEGGNAVWLALNGDAPAVAHQGIMLAASTTLEISFAKDNFYKGAITAITASGSSVLDVTGK